jgi:hypothetical protein
LNRGEQFEEKKLRYLLVRSNPLTKFLRSQVMSLKEGHKAFSETCIETGDEDGHLSREFVLEKTIAMGC